MSAPPTPRPLREAVSEIDHPHRAIAPAVLVGEDQLETHFQPIVSLHNGTIFAVEALSRAFEPHTQRLIPPATLFGIAEELELLFDFDRFCRRKALERFASVSAEPHAITLNWDVRTLARHAADPEPLARLVDEVGIPRSSVIIEVLESRVDDLASLVRFSRAYKNEGFLIAIDDYGTGHSTPERLARIEPDIIKIDRALVHGLSHSRAQLESCRSVVMLARRLGALVVAEGIEDEEDVVAAAMIGVDLFQGFAFARPGASIAEVSRFARDNVRRYLPAVREESRRRAESRRRSRKRHEASVTSVIQGIEALDKHELDENLEFVLDLHPDVEAIYVLDEHGIQLTRTALREPPRRALFRAAPPGADQSLKAYFLELSPESPRYVSPPYLSTASGNACVTHSRYARTRDGLLVVVCCDLSVDVDSM